MQENSQISSIYHNNHISNKCYSFYSLLSVFFTFIAFYHFDHFLVDISIICCFIDAKITNRLSENTINWAISGKVVFFLGKGK